MMNSALTKKELAAIAGYSYRMLYEINMNLPNDRKLFVTSGEGGNKYDLAMFVQRWVMYNTQLAKIEGDEDLEIIKAKHEAVKMQKSQIEVLRLQGEYVSVNALAPLWTQIAAAAAERFNSLAAKLAPSLVMISDPEIIEGMIEREVRDALSLLSAMPLPGMEEAAEGTGDEEE